MYSVCICFLGLFSVGLWVNKSLFFHINFPLLFESSDCAMIRSSDSTAFHGGSKCDDSYVRALKEGPAQERQTLTNRCSSPGTEGSGQLGAQETEMGSVVTVCAF